MLVYIPAIVLSLVAVLYFFNPFKHVSFPAFWEFLKNPQFTPIGSQLDTVVFLGLAAILSLSEIFNQKDKENKFRLLPISVLVLALIGSGVLLFSLMKTKDSIVFPPLNLSWYAAVETLKQPLTALFGVGVDNYASMFTRVKDIGYNSSRLWQITSFNASRSTFLHVVTEMGVFGFIAFGLLMLKLVAWGTHWKKQHGNTVLYPILYIMTIALLFPPSPTILFILFLLVGGISIQNKHAEGQEPSVFNTGSILPLYVVILAGLFVFVGFAAYFAGRSYAAEIYFHRAISGFNSANAKDVYDNMRKAIITNPYIERYRSNFAQTNLLLANNIATSATQGKEEGEKIELSEEQRQTISQAIQAAIEEAKATVTLNPQKAINWETLAAIYQNIINVAQGADSWTVSAYQRAIMLDPQNPIYRLNLGGVFFSLKNYNEAEKLFEQAVAIKPDWPNAYYNLAWAAYQKQDYQKAALSMQSTVSLLDPKKDEADFKKASEDLEEFKKMLPKEEETTEEAQEKPTQLAVPTPAQELEPKIELPKDASPEAR